MRDTLKRYGLNTDMDIDEILEILEEKQMEYLSRLDDVDDEVREKRYRESLEEVEKAIQYYHNLKTQKEKKQPVDPTYENACKLLNSGDKKRAIEILLQLAQEDHAQAQWKLGVIYSKDSEYKAEQWFLKSAISGYKNAMRDLALFYERQGKINKAVKWYMRGEDAGIGFCKKSLMRLCRDNLWTPGNKNAFTQLYYDAAMNGDMDALKRMGDLYWYGIFTEPDKKAAIDWYIRAAERGDEYAIKHLHWYQSTLTMETWHDYEYKHIFTDIFNKYAEQGLPAAVLAKAVLCYKNHVEYWPGVDEKDIGNAVRYLTQAATMGNAEAAARLGEMYWTGEYVNRNRVWSIEFYQLVKKCATPADMKNEFVKPWIEKAYLVLGKSYEKGQYGVHKDINVAIECYQWLAEYGNVDMQLYLGALYMNGKKIDKDVDLAGNWLKKASDNGSVEAQFLLGELAGTNYEEAIRWYLMAAQNDHAKAMMKIGEMYEKGLGVSVNSKEALKWYNNAYTAGVYEAASCVRRVKSLF